MPNKKTNLSSIIILAIVTLGFLLRLLVINQSFWLDEAAQAIESARPLSQQLRLEGDFQPPLYHLIVHFMMKISSYEWWLRLASIIPGIITIFAVMKLTDYIFNKKTAALAGLFLATSSFHIFYSQELRPYSLAAMWAVISMWFFFTQLVRKKTTSIGYILSSALGLYSMYLFPFIILSQILITTRWHRQYLTSVIKNTAITAIFFVPWLPSFIGQLKTGMALNQTLPGWGTAVSLPWHKSIPLTTLKFVLGRIDVQTDLIGIVISALVIGLLIYFAIKVNKDKKTKPIIIWLITPILVAFAVSFFVPILEPKRVLISLPALFILMAVAINHLKPRKVFIGLILAINLITTALYVISPRYQREQWRQAVTYIEATAPNNSLAVFAFSEPFAPWQWYQKNIVPSITTDTLRVKSITDLNTSLKPTLITDRLYVFEYLMDITDPNRLVFDWLDENRFIKVKIKDFPGVGFLHIYQRQNPFATVD